MGFVRERKCRTVIQAIVFRPDERPARFNRTKWLIHDFCGFADTWGEIAMITRTPNWERGRRRFAPAGQRKSGPISTTTSRAAPSTTRRRQDGCWTEPVEANETV